MIFGSGLHSQLCLGFTNRVNWIYWQWLLIGYFPEKWTSVALLWVLATKFARPTGDLSLACCILSSSEGKESHLLIVGHAPDVHSIHSGFPSHGVLLSVAIRKKSLWSFGKFQMSHKSSVAQIDIFIIHAVHLWTEQLLFLVTALEVWVRIRTHFFLTFCRYIIINQFPWNSST